MFRLRLRVILAYTLLCSALTILRFLQFSGENYNNGNNLSFDSNLKQTGEETTSEQVSPDLFHDLDLEPNKLSYPNSEKASVDNLNVHKDPKENWQNFQNNIVTLPNVVVSCKKLISALFISA